MSGFYGYGAKKIGKTLLWGGIPLVMSLGAYKGAKWSYDQVQQAQANEIITRRNKQLMYRWELFDGISNNESMFAQMVCLVNLIMINQGYPLSQQSSNYLYTNVRRLENGEYTQSCAHWEEVKHWKNLYQENREMIYVLGMAMNFAGTLFGSALFSQKGFSGVDGSDPGQDIIKIVKKS